MLVPPSNPILVWISVQPCMWENLSALASCGPEANPVCRLVHPHLTNPHGLGVAVGTSECRQVILDHECSPEFPSQLPSALLPPLPRSSSLLRPHASVYKFPAPAPAGLNVFVSTRCQVLKMAVAPE